MSKEYIKLTGKKTITKMIPDAYEKGLSLVVEDKDGSTDNKCKKCGEGEDSQYALLNDVTNMYPNKRVIIKVCPHASNNVASMYIEISK